MPPNFEQLRDSLDGGYILLPGDSGFEESLRRWSATAVKPAAAVIRPRTADECSTAIRFITANSLAFTVRGGGHNPSGESAAPNPEAVVLDLEHLRSVSVDTQAQTVTFGGGCTWADVDNALWEHGLATVGGTVADTGVGGLILGGGYGVLSGRHGLAIDVLLSCEVVLASGEIVLASETENADLFWALRGAGTNFGVVTAFTSRAFPQTTVWAGVLMWPNLHGYDGVVAFVNQFAQETDGDQCLMLIVTANPETGEPMLGASIFYNGSAAEAERFYAPLLKMQPLLMNTTGEVPYPAVNTLTQPRFGSMQRYMFGGAKFTCPLDPGHEDLRTSALALEMVSTKKIQEFGQQDKTAFNGRDASFNVLVLMNWRDEKLDPVVGALARRTSAVFRAKEAEGNGEERSPYLNYLNPDVPADRVAMRTGRLFGDKLPRLRELKAKYDPENVFKKTIKLHPTHD
ncbi:hypothetical protein B0I35DRAFT_449802 [Stachybotrys elegans]|uniref:FAD-binding PCMH-type domain-containing protein n=1 Tax=Stachybotrys elegans TaxID=80388 RepID=A0A8K0SY28_9HYPO|nr:hypothetical protein B0I35DRAFT_449802 [Stachybotrys elegans]